MWSGGVVGRDAVFRWMGLLKSSLYGMRKVIVPFLPFRRLAFWAVFPQVSWLGIHNGKPRRYRGSRISGILNVFKDGYLHVSV